MEVTECACCRYIPVYALPAILVHRQKLIGPEAATIWAKLAVAAARSSLFLALYCTLAWRGMKSVHFISEIAAFRLRPECSLHCTLAWRGATPEAACVYAVTWAFRTFSVSVSGSTFSIWQHSSWKACQPRSAIAIKLHCSQSAVQTWQQ